MSQISAYNNIKVNVETSADEGNEETDVYLKLLGHNQQGISQELKLGKFEEGESREFRFNVDNPNDLKCLKFTLKGGTDGWTMEKVPAYQFTQKVTHRVYIQYVELI